MSFQIAPSTLITLLVTILQQITGWQAIHTYINPFPAKGYPIDE